jgi:ParB family chromosome partitioning protein
MSEDGSKNRLGRGLAALIGDIDRPAPQQTMAPPSPQPDRTVRVEHILPNPRNPRRSFSDAELDDLAASLKQHGVMQPVVVRPMRPSGFEIIAGERRWRAAQRAGIEQIPVIIRDVDDRTALELAIVENVQRSDLNPVEEAMGYQQLIDEHDYAQAELAQIIGKSRSHVANTLRLLKLPQDIRDMLVDGALSAGHARTLVTADDPKMLAQRIVRDGLSVRQAEALAQQKSTARSASPRSQAEEKDADTRALEQLLANATGLKVQISHKESGGELRIVYKTLEQLDELCRRLQR